MSWSFRIGKVAGIPIFIHWTFLILIGWIVFLQVSHGHDLRSTIEAVGFVLSLFGCIVLHELGHALAAKRFGVPTADITLLPIGGVARLQRIPEHPRQELVVALAGPAVNVVIVVLLFLLGVRIPYPLHADEFLPTGEFWSSLMLYNAFLFLFNLLPAFPMDGGRVLRALLAMNMDYARATRAAASVGQIMAMLFALLGLINPFLLLIAIFVWIGAEAEARQVQERMVLKDVPVREAMLTDFETLQPSDTLGHAVDRLLAGSQQDFPVLDGAGHAGVLTRQALMAGLAQHGREASVATAPLERLDQIDSSAALVPALARLRDEGLSCLLVVEKGQPIGLLNLENIGEFLMIRAALEHVGQAKAHAT